MKIIEIGGQRVNIPERCDDLSEKDYVYLAKQIYRHVSGEIDSFDLKMLVLLNALNLRVVKKHVRQISYNDLFRYLLFFFWSYFRKILHLISKSSHKEICLAARECYFRKEMREDYLCENLIGLCDDLKFMQGEKLDLFFSKNPIKKIKCIGTGKRFDIGIALLTDFTAGEYADAMDIAIAWEQTKDPKLLDMLIALLYFTRKDNADVDMINIIDNKRLQAKLNKVKFEVKYGVYLWFISISTYFYNHQMYSLLYTSKKGDADADKIRIGMNEGIFRLSKCGYGSHLEIRNKNLVEFMDMQLSEVQCSVREALASGIEPAKLSEKTGYSLTQIEQLS